MSYDYVAISQQIQSIVISIPSAIIAVLSLVAGWRICVKAGIPGWAAIIPIYNAYVLFKITWGNGWMFLYTILPIVNIIVFVITMIKLARAFGKGTLFGWGLVFFNLIFTFILAFDKSEYHGCTAM
ncbi:MAG: DUF5684 domain-containing protein [Selenomonadaceae bacterium]